MNETIRSLRASLEAEQLKYEPILAKGEKGEAVTPEEEEIAEKAVAAAEDYQARIEAENARSAKLGGLGEKARDLQKWREDPMRPAPFSGKPAPTFRADMTESADEKYLKRGAFKGLGHLAYLVERAGVTPGLATEGVLGEWNAHVRKIHDHIQGLPIHQKAVSGMSELIDGDGGVLVPVDMAKGVWERTQGDEENLLRLVDVIPVRGNALSIPAWNDKSRTSGSLYGGARAYWLPEGGQKTPSRPEFRRIDLRLNKLAVLMYVTDELREDAVALDSRLERVAAGCFTYEINKAIVRGSGVGQPLGILSVANAGSGGPKIVATAVSAQGAGTIIGANITAMYSRRPPSSSSRLVWLYNIDVEPMLDQLNFTVAGTNSIAANWLYTTNLRDGSGDPRLKGRRMIECEHCSALGTEGDLILFDPMSYVAIVKTNGIQGAVSMHLRFDYDETAFRWVFRMDGRPAWDEALTPATGNTRSPIVTLSSTRT